MSKAVLVLNMPKSCNKCKFFDSQYRYCDFKGLPLKRKDGKYGPVTKISKERADWCPLRELPEKRDLKELEKYSLGEEYLWSEGWNACIDEITGEHKPTVAKSATTEQEGI